MSKGRGRDLRVGHPERERAITLLGEHMSAGRLDVAEFDHRCERVAVSQYESDIRALFDDLPEPRPADAAPAPRSSGSKPSGQLVLGICLVTMVLVLAVVAKQAWLLVILLLGGTLWFTRRRD
ncbi:hypothetical protein FHX42_004272 [Saccharopolyspora lacisalsi]|uniref:DUF1707 domain-containing protein n=1 Tax=Halosaccharopolyspora lacisalsi TaxID=1000566 RepID=A0A839E0T1_9PSEU|nr:DUF1707 domain-containing protein [Halosaccharopolyspora lacisalsi]MBA8826893.1 hypothetical protein [Halosaccharopolyspora lacisalsi]